MLTAKFSCQKCGIERPIQIRERFTNEDVVAYMNYAVGEAGQQHTFLSPVCFATHVDIYLPVTKNGIGFAGEPMTPEEQAEIAEQLRKPK